MLHRHGARPRGRWRFGALALCGVVLVGACTGGGDDKGAHSDQPSSETTAADASSATDIGPGPTSTTESTGTTADESDLPTLPDITTPEWEPETRTDELAAQIGEKELTPQQAVDALALIYPDMPGATPSALPAGPGLDPSYTWILVRKVYDRLAPDQQAFVDEAAASEPIGTIGPDGATTTLLADQEIPGVGDPPADGTEGTVLTDNTDASGSTTGTESPTATDATDDLVKPDGFVMRRPSAGKQTYARYFELATQAYNDWQAHRADLPPFTIQLDLSKKGPATGMDTGAVVGVPHTCRTRVSPGFVAKNHSDALIKFYFVHEMFHCIQDQWAPGLDWTAAKWLFDGSADFAAADVYRNVYVPPHPYLETTWFTSPNKALSYRWYDAWALFETLWEEGGDPIQATHAMLVKFAGGDVAANLANGGMDGELFRMKWSSRSYRSSQHPADDWQLDWPGPNPGAGPRENRKNDGTRGVGQYDVKVGGGYTHVQKVVQMDSKVGVVDVTPAGAPLTTETAAGVIHVADGSTVRLCFAADGCKCRDETDSGAQQMAGREVVFSFASSADPTAAHVEARPWDETTKKEKCKKKQPKRASSNGDPHLLTFDGEPFDMMTLGEFVTSRDPAGDFEVQTRNVTPPGIIAGTLSSAVAIKTGEHRITFQVKDILQPDGLVVRVDGEPTTDADLDLDGVTVHREDPNATLTWPDGTTVELEWHIGYFVTITPADARAGTLEGLLGAADGDFVNDLRMPDGSIVDPVHAAVPDSAFSLAWRVTEDNTLFDYDAGESVATFALPYPADALAAAVDPSAEERCQEALGPDAVSHEIRSCAYDVTVTNDASYTDAYREVVDDRVAAESGDEDVPTDDSTPPPPDSVATPTSTGTAALTLSGTLVASYADDVGPDDVVALTGTVEATSGTVMVFHAERCAPDATLFLTVTKHDSGEQGNMFICDPNGLTSAQAGEDDEVIPGEVYMWLPADGDYDIDIETDAEEASFVNVDVYVDADPTIVDGAGVVTDGYRGTLRGIGDTVVITSADVGATFEATGFDRACAQEAYGAEPVGSDSVWPLAGFCAHSDTVSLPGSDVPLVMFSRTADPVNVELTPSS